MNVMHELLHRSGGVIDPWDFLDPAANPPGEVKTFVVTPEMVERDARERAARQALSPEHPWAAFKASLGKVVHRSAPARYEPRGRIQRPRKPGRLCAGCKRPVAHNMKGELCMACRPQRTPRVPRVALAPRFCACGEPTSRRSRGSCRRCYTASKPKPEPKLVRLCGCCQLPLAYNSKGVLCRTCRPQIVVRSCSMCPRRLRVTNLRDTCWQCEAKRTSRALPIPLVKCSNDACSRMLRRGRTEGPCGRCKAEARSEETAAVRQARYTQARNEKAGKRCKGCRALMKYNSNTDRCRKCGGATRACRTVLRARSQEELELDRAWAELSVEYKRAVFEDVLTASGGGVTKSGECGRVQLGAVRLRMLRCPSKGSLGSDDVDGLAG